MTALKFSINSVRPSNLLPLCRLIDQQCLQKNKSKRILSHFIHQNKQEIKYKISNKTQIKIENEIQEGQIITFGIYEDNRPCASDPGERAKLRNAESTDAFSFRLNAMVRRTARRILRTSRAQAPVSISEAISFKSENKPKN